MSETLKITYEPGKEPRFTCYGLFNHRGLMKVLTEQEAQELAREHPEIRHLMPDSSADGRPE